MTELVVLAMNGSFQPFSVSHWTALILVATVNILVYLHRDRLRNSRLAAYAHGIMIVLLLLLALSMQAWYYLNGTWTVQESLPLHLCDFSLFICGLMLFTNNYTLYELAYFWGVGGSVQALVTPNLGYVFPHLVFFQFFMLHGLILTVCLWVTFVDGLRPTSRSVWKVLGITNIYMLLVAVLDYLTGANYMFLCQKPFAPSLLDIMGPWPWYILTGELVALLMFYLCYLPFAWKRIWARLSPQG